MNPDLTLLRSTLEDAAFWDQHICLNCGNTQSTQAPCAECESDEVHPAERILAIGLAFEDNVGG